MSSFFSNVTWVDTRTAEYLQWKYKNSIDPNDEEFKDAGPGVYVNAEYSNDFLARRVFASWLEAITSPFNIGVISTFGAVRAKSSAPRDISNNIISELVMMFLMTTVFYIVFICCALLIDLLVMLPWMLINIYMHNNSKNQKNLTPEVEQQLARIPEQISVINEARLLSHVKY